MKKRPHKKNLDDPVVEILDNTGQAIVYMPLSESIKKKLTRKISLITIKNKKNQILLQKYRSKKSLNELWDISIYSDVYAGESFEEAALRTMHDQLHIKSDSLTMLTQIPYVNENDIKLLATIFQTNKLALQEHAFAQLYKNTSEIMFIHPHELEAIISHSPEIFTAELIWASQAGWLNK